VTIGQVFSSTSFSLVNKIPPILYTYLSLHVTVFSWTHEWSPENFQKTVLFRKWRTLDRKVFSRFLIFKKRLPPEGVTVIGVRITLACTMEGIVGYVSAHVVRYPAKANRMYVGGRVPPGLMVRSRSNSVNWLHFEQYDTSWEEFMQQKCKTVFIKRKIIYSTSY